MRRRKAPVREVLAETKYNSKLVTFLISMVMRDGKRNTAEQIVYGALELVKQRLNEKDALAVLNKAIENARPRVEVKARRIAGATFQVPIEIRADRGNTLAIRWIRDIARNRKGKPMMEKLADEISAAYKNEGTAIKKRDDTHKMAEANRAFAHFRW